jgi:hypothetical protein
MIATRALGIVRVFDSKSYPAKDRTKPVTDSIRRMSGLGPYVRLSLTVALSPAKAV